jgi:hypothetical protein
VETKGSAEPSLRHTGLEISGDGKVHKNERSLVSRCYTPRFVTLIVVLFVGMSGEVSSFNRWTDQRRIRYGFYTTGDYADSYTFNRLPTQGLKFHLLSKTVRFQTYSIPKCIHDHKVQPTTAACEESEVRTLHRVWTRMFNFCG